MNVLGVGVFFVKLLLEIEIESQKEQLELNNLLNAQVKSFEEPVIQNLFSGFDRIDEIFNNHK